MDNQLHVVTVVSNPLRWESRVELANKAITNWLQEPNVKVTFVEVAYGSRAYDFADSFPADRVQHVPLRATTMAWSKECCLNIGISRTDGAYIAALDADILFRKKGWADEVVQTLQLYPVIQPWNTCYDLGPHDSHIQTHTSFCSLYLHNKPVGVPNGQLKWAGGPYDHAHPGFAWAYKREVLDKIGGLFEVGGMGSGDHHMALSLVGKSDVSLPGGCSAGYRNFVKTWESRALAHVNRKIGYVPNTIEHMFHGDKNRRGYETRWGMFVKHGFDPLTDLKRNSYGVLEFAGNKPDLERDFDNYLRSREEDANIIG